MTLAATPRTLRRLTALLGIVFVTGCTGTTQVGHRYSLMKTLNGELLTGVPVICSAPTCSKALVTNDPHDEEFWQFETRIKIRSLNGIAYGREPRDYNVIGSRERCEDERIHWTARSIPTERCRGPFFFRREPVTGAIQASSADPVEYSGAPYAYLGVAGGPPFADQFYVPTARISSSRAMSSSVVGEPRGASRAVCPTSAWHRD
jgi:hypothetical protein